MSVEIIPSLVASGDAGGPGLVVGFLSIASLGALVRLNLAVERYTIPAVIFSAVSLFLVLAAGAGFGQTVLSSCFGLLFGLLFFGRLKAAEGERSWQPTLVLGVSVYLIWAVVFFWWLRTSARTLEWAEIFGQEPLRIRSILEG